MSGGGELPERSGAFGGFIGPRNLLALVRSTAPFLFDAEFTETLAPPSAGSVRLDELARGPLGWLSVLRAGERLVATEAPSEQELTEYFALCLSAHFGTVATFVPTDVDTKIRDRLWFAPRGDDELERVAGLALGLSDWDVSMVSKRIVTVEGFGPVSGHDGERLSVLCGGLLALEARGHEPLAARFLEAIEAELDREARAFDQIAIEKGAERETLILAAALTHNAGDVDQGLSAREGQPVAHGARERFGRLAHEGEARFGGAFTRAARLYRELMAAEGHRNYPLREITELRKSSNLLLPVSPFLDDWGGILATDSCLSEDERAQVVSGIALGIKRVKGQIGYHRALAGFAAAHRMGFSDAYQKSLSNAARKILKEADVRQKIAVRRVSFESSLAKRVRALLS